MRVLPAEIGKFAQLTNIGKVRLDAEAVTKRGKNALPTVWTYRGTFSVPFVDLAPVLCAPATANRPWNRRHPPPPSAPAAVTRAAQRGGGSAFDVKFLTLDGPAVAVVSLSASQVRPIGKREVPHAKPFTAL